MPQKHKTDFDTEKHKGRCYLFATLVTKEFSSLPGCVTGISKLTYLNRILDYPPQLQNSLCYYKIGSYCTQSFIFCFKKRGVGRTLTKSYWAGKQLRWHPSSHQPPVHTWGTIHMQTSFQASCARYTGTSETWIMRCFEEFKLWIKKTAGTRVTSRPVC